MPEIQKADQSNGQTTQRFIEFVMMQAQQAMLCLGRLPYPTTGETMMNLDAARMFIDHLELLREKTQGNLSKDEEKVLTSVLSELQMGFVQASQNLPHGDQEGTDEASTPVEQKESFKEESAAASDADKEREEEENKKRFSKSYGS